jgi:hypothetical protein
VYQSMLWRGAAEAHAVVSRIARNSARSYQWGGFSGYRNNSIPETAHHCANTV